MSFDPAQYCPYEPYQEQAVAMHKIYNALEAGKIYLLEGACGTGKTLAALVPAISLSKSTGRLIVVATNVNEQKQAFIKEVRGLQARMTGLRVVVMESKKSICYFNNTIEEDEEEVSYDKCKTLRDNNECRAYSRVKGEPIGKESEDEAKRLAMALRIKFEKWLFSSVRTPAEIAAWGVENEACSYKLVLQALGTASIVICDIRLILNQNFMRIFSFYTGKGLSGMMLICDEAHNIGKIAKDVYKRGISESKLSSAILEISELEVQTRNMKGRDIAELDLDRSKSFVTDVLLKSLQGLEIPENIRKAVTYHYEDSVICFADPRLPYFERSDRFYELLMENTKIHFQNDRHREIEDSMVLEEFLKLLNKLLLAGVKKADLDLNADPSYDDTPACVTVSNFICDYLKLKKENGYWPFLTVKKNMGGALTRRINIYLSLPEVITAPVFKAVYAAVLMSATLAPLKDLKAVLGIERETDEQLIGLQFPISNRQTYVILRDVRHDSLAQAAGYTFPHPDTLKSSNANNPASIRYIKDSLDIIIETVHYNILIYFTNKKQAEYYHRELKSKYGDRVLLDSGGKITSEIKNRFFDMGEKHERGILCTYIGGTLSEGVDFKDKRARVVVIIGVGYTKGSLFMTADETAYREKYKKINVYDLVVQIPTIHKVRQAMGRVIRGENDYGVRILLDARYKKSISKYGSVNQFFPEVESKEFKVRSVTQLRDILRRDFGTWDKNQGGA